jgi:hypothetical protein
MTPTSAPHTARPFVTANFARGLAPSDGPLSALVVVGPLAAAALALALCGCGPAPDEVRPTPFDAGDSDDIVAEADDFRCLDEAVRVDQFYVQHLGDRLDEAVAVAEAGEGAYPVGTLLQLVPQEAMVKRAPGFSPETHDWELFFLSVSAEGTVIEQRGRGEVSGPFGRCVDCHGEAEPAYDFTCRIGQGCEDTPHLRPMFDLLASSDPRCD